MRMYSKSRCRNPEIMMKSENQSVTRRTWNGSVVSSEKTANSREQISVGAPESTLTLHFSTFSPVPRSSNSIMMVNLRSAVTQRLPRAKRQDRLPPPRAHSPVTVSYGRERGGGREREDRAKGRSERFMSGLAHRLSGCRRQLRRWPLPARARRVAEARAGAPLEPARASSMRVMVIVKDRNGNT